MGREGWIYALLFVGVLGAGALLIGPRLLRFGGPARSPETFLEETPLAAAVEEEAPGRVFDVRVRGRGGPLRAPLREIEGAEILDGSSPGGREPVLTLRLRARRVVFRAPGHLGRALTAIDLEVSGGEIVLEDAAPPIRLQVHERDGSPASDVPVLVEGAPGGVPPRTGPDGTVLLDELAPGLVVLDVGGGRERRGPVLRLVAGEDEEATATLEPAWVIAGRVVEAGGTPLGGVEVRMLAQGFGLGATLRTDDDGRFTWRGPVVGTASLRLRAPPTRSRRIEVRPPARGELFEDLGDLVLEGAGGSLEGHLRVAPGLGRPTVTVEPSVSAIMREVFGSDALLDVPYRPPVDEDGWFRLAGLVPGLRYRISVRGAGIPVDHEVTLQPGGEPARFELVPPPGRRLVGRVLDAARGGSPVAGLRLYVNDRPLDGDVLFAGDRTTVTAADGSFEITGLLRGEAFLRAYPRDRRTLLRRLVLPRADRLRLDVEDPVTDPRLEGVVVDEMNAPLPGVRVYGAGRETFTGADGRFVLPGVETFGEAVELAARFEPGRPSPAVDPRPFTGGVVRRVGLDDPPSKLVLPRARTLTFRVVDGIDDVPLSFLHAVVLTDDQQVVVDRPVATLAGGVVLQGLPPVGLTLALFSHRHRLVRTMPLRSDASTAVAAFVDLGELRLSHGMRITGRVVDSAGVPVPGARLGGLESGWLRARSPDPTLRRELALRTTVTDAEGRFDFEGFDPRRPAVLAAWAPGFAPVARRAVVERFREDVTVEMDLLLRKGGWLSVELVEAGTEDPISGAFLDLEDARTSSDYLDVLRRGMLGGPIASDIDWRLANTHFLIEKRLGFYQLGPVAPGPYKVWIERPGFRPLERRLSILDPEDELVGVTHVGARARGLGDLLTQTWEMRPGP